MGYSVVSTVLSAAASQDLTDLATAKVDLGISSSTDDAWLSRAISQVSRAIATHTQRVFLPERVRDDFDLDQDPYPYQTPAGFPQLQLARWPVLSVQSVTQTIAAGTTQPLTEGVDFRVDPATGQLLRLNPFTGVGSNWESIPVTVTYVAGYGAVAQETHAVPASPFSVTVSQSAAFSCDLSVAYANGTALARVTANPGAGQYSVAAGGYTFAAADLGQSIEISYAVASIPADLVDISLRLVTGRYKAKGRDPALIQRDTPGVGMERWWFGGAPGQTGPFPPDIEGALAPYCMPVVV